MIYAAHCGIMPQLQPWRTTVKYCLVPVCIAVLALLGACGSAPKEVEMKSAFEPADFSEPRPLIGPPDYTRDWRSVADIAGPTEYPAYVVQILWKRLNWRMTLSGEWVDDIVEDMQRRYRWDKKLKEWVAEKGNPEWPR